MSQPCFAKAQETSGRKRTRNVSNLTPSQLSRKRAYDRDAQRKLRTKTKEYIGRLERELEELRSNQSRDKTIQELLRRNRHCEHELQRLKESISGSIISPPYLSSADSDYNILNPVVVHSDHSTYALPGCDSHQISPSCPLGQDNQNLSSSTRMLSPPMITSTWGYRYAPLHDYSQQQQVLQPNCYESQTANLTGSVMPSSFSNSFSSVHADSTTTHFNIRP